MVRVDRDLKRCYFYRIKHIGDVKKPPSPRELSPEPTPIDEPAVDIIPYNPHFRKRQSRHSSRPPTRRISWSSDADRVREISPRSEGNTDYITPINNPIRRPQSDDWTSETYAKPKKVKGSNKPKKDMLDRHGKQRQNDFVPDKINSYKNPKKQPVVEKKMKNGKNAHENNTRQVKEQHFQPQKRAQRQQKPTTTNLRKTKSEGNLLMPKEPLMKQTSKMETGKNTHANPPRWRHVGDRNRHRPLDKNSRSFVSDYYF